MKVEAEKVRALWLGIGYYSTKNKNWRAVDLYLPFCWIKFEWGGDVE